MKAVGGLLIVAALAIGSGCAGRPDWIERTLVTVDMTGIWQGTTLGPGGAYIKEELWLDLQQEGPKVKGSMRASGGHTWQGFRSGAAAIEGTIAGDVFSFRRPDAAMTGEFTVGSNEMTGNVNGFPFILRRVGSSSRPGS